MMSLKWDHLLDDPTTRSYLLQFPPAAWEEKALEAIHNGVKTMKQKQHKVATSNIRSKRLAAEEKHKHRAQTEAKTSSSTDQQQHSQQQQPVPVHPPSHQHQHRPSPIQPPLSSHYYRHDPYITASSAIGAHHLQTLLATPVNLFHHSQRNTNNRAAAESYRARNLYTSSIVFGTDTDTQADRGVKSQPTHKTTHTEHKEQERKHPDDASTSKPAQTESREDIDSKTPEASNAWIHEEKENSHHHTAAVTAPVCGYHVSTDKQKTGNDIIINVLCPYHNQQQNGRTASIAASKQVEGKTRADHANDSRRTKKASQGTEHTTSITTSTIHPTAARMHTAASVAPVVSAPPPSVSFYTEGEPSSSASHHRIHPSYIHPHPVYPDWWPSQLELERLERLDQLEKQKARERESRKKKRNQRENARVRPVASHVCAPPAARLREGSTYLQPTVERDQTIRANTQLRIADHDQMNILTYSAPLPALPAPAPQRPAWAATIPVSNSYQPPAAESRIKQLIDRDRKRKQEEQGVGVTAGTRTRAPGATHNYSTLLRQLASDPVIQAFHHRQTTTATDHTVGDSTQRNTRKTLPINTVSVAPASATQSSRPASSSSVTGRTDNEEVTEMPASRLSALLDPTASHIPASASIEELRGMREYDKILQRQQEREVERDKQRRREQERTSPQPRTARESIRGTAVVQDVADDEEEEDAQEQNAQQSFSSLSNTQTTPSQQSEAEADR